MDILGRALGYEDTADTRAIPDSTRITGITSPESPRVPASPPNHHSDTVDGGVSGVF